MRAYIIRRLGQGVLILFIVTLVVFLMMHFLPGDPLLLYITEQDFEQITEEEIENLKIKFGLDKPIMAQYGTWLSGIFRGDLGSSLVFAEEPVADIIGKRLLITVHLGVMALVLSSVIGILAGVICAVRRGRWLDTVVTLFANFGVCIPIFWLGILAIYLFGLRLGWLPIYGYTSPFEDFWLSTRQAIMPVTCLAIFSMASKARQTRSSMLEVIRQDYIRTAWSKGLSERLIITRHTLKNGLIPVITMIGMHVKIIFGGSVLVETVFNIPGVGRMMIEAIFRQDYTVVQGGILVIAVVVVLANLAVDISYGWFDPRVRYG